MTVDDLVLQIHTGVVDDEQDAVADHKGDSRAEAVGNEDVQDDQDQCHIEEMCIRDRWRCLSTSPL